MLKAINQLLHYTKYSTTTLPPINRTTHPESTLQSTSSHHTTPLSPINGLSIQLPHTTAISARQATLSLPNTSTPIYRFIVLCLASPLKYKWTHTLLLLPHLLRPTKPTHSTHLPPHKLSHNTVSHSAPARPHLIRPCGFPPPPHFPFPQ